MCFIGIVYSWVSCDLLFDDSASFFCLGGCFGLFLLGLGGFFLGLFGLLGCLFASLFGFLLGGRFFLLGLLLGFYLGLTFGFLGFSHLGLGFLGF